MLIMKSTICELFSGTLLLPDTIGGSAKSIATYSQYNWKLALIQSDCQRNQSECILNTIGLSAESIETYSQYNQSVSLIQSDCQRNQSECILNTFGVYS